MKTQRRYQEIAARISRYIAENGLQPGDRLPGEIDLAKVCGVSRPTIREAMVALEIAGELEIRSGSGAYVRKNVNPMSLVLDSGPGPFELLRARILIEGEIAADAALYASAADLERVELALREMRELVAGKINAQANDRAFHVAIGEAAKNSVLASIVDGLWAGMFSPMYHRLSQRARMEGYQAEALRDHEDIFAAIQARNPNDARKAMRRHLQNVEQHLAESDVPLSEELDAVDASV
ncbi:FadR/GntR family transcriptional regulator [Granulicella cerasi]|uniref:FadR/GntR family transcriptional regulator n=1 Tax=Granulicella cerasi TaxID=741063 RepID=A0ABW1ZEE9_9BACT|nr:FadR/GntR family transcriptional regulator [Granulicella cerasi]